MSRWWPYAGGVVQAVGDVVGHVIELRRHAGAVIDHVGGSAADEVDGSTFDPSADASPSPLVGGGRPARDRRFGAPDDEEQTVAITVRDQPDESRYEIWDGDQLAGFTRYEHDGDRLAFVHTEVGDEFEGRGLAKRLVADALDDVRGRGLQILPYCPFVARFVRKNREYQDLVPDDERGRFGLPATSPVNP